MDSLTHLLVGHAMGAVVSSSTQPFGTAAYWAVLVGNSLPDIDVPISLVLTRDIKLHRTVTHTLPGAVLLASIAAVVMTHFFPGVPLYLLFAWLMLGSLSHMALDVLNLFGSSALWPVFKKPINLGVLHIVDPALLILSGVPTLGQWLKLTGPGPLHWGFYLMGPYLLYRIANAVLLSRRLRGDGVLRVRIVPWYLGWRYILEKAESIEFGAIRGGRCRVIDRYIKRHDSPLIQATLADPAVQRFLKLSEYPYAKIEEDDAGPLVVWADAMRQMRADFRPLKVRIPAA